VLRDEDELEARRARAARARVPVEETPEGPLLRDPSGNALLFVTG
jgi:hypothetical protein